MRYATELVAADAAARDRDLGISLVPAGPAVEAMAPPEVAVAQETFWAYEFWATSFPGDDPTTSGSVAHDTGTSDGGPSPSVMLKNGPFVLLLEAVGVDPQAGSIWIASEDSPTGFHTVPAGTSKQTVALFVGPEIGRFVSGPGAPHEEAFYKGMENVTIRCTVGTEVVGEPFVVGFPG